MREAHILGRTKTIRMPKRMVFFDSEAKTDTEIHDWEIDRAAEGEKVRKEHDPYLVCATFYKRYKGRKKPGERERDYYQGNFLDAFWKDVDRFTTLKDTTYVFAHNAKYDVQVTQCVPIMVRLGYRVVSFSDANPFILRMEKEVTHSPKTGKAYEEPKKKTVLILSSTNYYQQSLAKLGDVFGLPKMDFEHGQDVIIEDAIPYCRRDVEILKIAMLKLIEFVEMEGLGSFSMTVAGQAFGAFRHRFMEDNTIYIHNDEKALNVEREAYAGGRTECFFMGDVPEPVKYVDVNSMYPYVMKNRLYPVKLVTRWDRCSVEKVKDIIMDGYLVCLRARVKTEEPIFHKKQERLIFPVGDFWTSLSTPEVIEGLNRGLIKEVEQVCVYEAGYIFDEYVSYFYQKRLDAKHEGDKVHDYLYKIFLNSLYGKFGQRNIKWEKIDDAPPEEIGVYLVYYPEKRKREMVKIFGGGVWKKNTEEGIEEAFHSFPAIAAHVTAYARMLLWRYMEAAGRENVFYSDTDSLFTNELGYQNLIAEDYINPDELGKLKLEDEGYLTVHGVKDYIFTKYIFDEKKNKKIKIENIKIKGISKNAKRLDNSPDGKLRFAVTQWGGFSDRLREKDFSNYFNKIVIKELKREYQKGIVEGNNVRPFILDEEKEQQEKMREELKKELNQLFLSDPMKHLCQLHGYIKVIHPGERYYGEYLQLNKKLRIKYFRIYGTPIDEWADEAGYSVKDVFDELNKLN